jgi:hypothetical protein
LTGFNNGYSGRVLEDAMLRPNAISAQQLHRDRAAKWGSMTELIWDGKYLDGKKVAPVRIALPFQTTETVNESSQDGQHTLDLFVGGREPEWRNRLIWGDKKS